MPYIVKGEPTSWTTENYKDKDFGYEYPGGLKLKPGSELHDYLRNMIWDRANESRMEMQKRFDSWREIDRTLTTYVQVKDVEKKIQDKDPDKPVTIVFPYTYSMLEALITYLGMAFFQDPIFQYEGVEDSDTVGALLMQLVVRLHTIKNKVALNLHTMFRDSLAYGVGPVLPGWYRRYGKRAMKSPSAIEGPLGMSINETTQYIDDLLFEGNDLTNIDPYMWLPDPTVSSNEIQKGEFFGWVDRTNYMNLLKEEMEPESGLFNVKYLRQKKDRRSTLALDQSDREAKHGGNSDQMSMRSMVLNSVDRIRMYITLIPSEWKLSDSDMPEKWYFELASDDIIIACHQAQYNHGMYPLAVASPEFDGYSITPIGRLEVLYGLQHTLDFLFNSHITNVRKAVNDMLVVDPYLVNIEDLRDPQPGKLIRLRRPAWGRGVDKVVQQLAVTDITRMNIQDSAYITQWMDRISGADQSMMGALRQSGPERLTSAEFQGTRGSAMSRLQHVAMVIGLQAMQDIGTMYAVHAQQFMKKDTYVKITGNYSEKLSKMIGGQTGSVRVTPYDLAVNYDLVVRDGSIPGGNFSQAWVDLFKTIGTTPELMQQFDVSRIFMYIATQLGAKNVEDFRRQANAIQTQTMPDEAAARQAEAGNLIPTNNIAGMMPQ